MFHKNKKTISRRYYHLSGSRGTITVFVTLIMVPVILLNAFIVDMTRVKLYGNQAVMVADNCAEAALTNYDNLLKEMYGLFAMSQDEAAEEALKQIEEYVKYSSFDPNSHTMLGESYEGFMPYSTANLQFGEFAYPDGANLGNDAVLQTQIGDFMRFRIVPETIQAMNGNSIEDAEELFKVLDQVMNQEDDIEIINKKVELEDKISELYEALYRYYLFVYGFMQYEEGIQDLNIWIRKTEELYYDYYNSRTVREYYEYANLDEDEMDEEKWKNYNPVSVKLQIHEQCRSYEDILSYAKYEFHSVCPIQNVVFLEKMDINLLIIGEHPKEYVGWYLGDIIDYGPRFVTQAEKLRKAITEYEDARDNMQTALELKDKEDDFRKKIEEDIHEADELIGIFLGDDNKYSPDDFVGMAQYLYDNSMNDHYYKENFDDIAKMLCNVGVLMEDAVDISEDTWHELEMLKIDYSDYKRFEDIEEYDAIAKKLTEKFGGLNPDREDEFRNRKKSAKKQSQDAIDKISDEPIPQNLRNIPNLDGLPCRDGSEGPFNLLGSIKEIASFFSGTLGDGAARLMLKYYAISYDFGMFSSRVSEELAGKSADELKNKDVVMESLTGVTYDGNANYLYGAELEYIYAGYRSSAENLKTCRNSILTFRAVMNYKSTYMIGAINDPLCRVRDAGNGILPGLGFIVEQALRFTIVVLETSEDWELLKSGDSVMFDKRELGDFSAVKSMASLFEPEEDFEINSKKSEGLKLSYNQYLRIMVILFTPNATVLERTRTLITLNMNLVDQNLGSNGTISKLTFVPENAHTAVISECSVHSNFAVMPQSFLNQVAGSDTTMEINDYGRSYFKFSIVRGY